MASKNVELTPAQRELADKWENEQKAKAALQ